LIPRGAVMAGTFSADAIARVRGESDSDRDPLDGGKLENGMALSLSGGGFKAAVYHLGGLIRLNKLGKLPELKRIATVSGGSITNAQLALQWNALTFDATKRATNFDQLVAAPVLQYCTTQNVDVPAALWGSLPIVVGGEVVERSVANQLFKQKTLQ